MLTNYIYVDISLIFVSLIAIFYFWMKWKHAYWENRGIPSVPGHWLFGHLQNSIFMRQSPAVIMGKLYQQARDDDDVLGIYILHKPFLLIRNAELIKQIVIKDFNLFPNHHFTGETANDKINASTLFTIKNPEWKYLRNKMSPVFTSGKLKSLFLLTQESAEEMRDYFHSHFIDDSKIMPFDVKETFYKYTTNVISSLAFGIRTNCFDTPSPEFYKYSREVSRFTPFRAFQFFCLFFLPSIGKYISGSILGDTTNYFRKVFWDSMDSRTASKLKRGDLIDSLLILKNEKPDNTFRFEGDALLAQAAIFFVAGRESTITTMSFALCELAKQLDIQKRVRQEILETIQNKGITYESVMNLKYLHQVISETLRMYPPAAIIDRVPIADYTFPGTNITIEKDTPVYIALYGLHNDPKYHPDPMRFDPDRFSDERKNDMVSCSYMPFGEGPRNCIGMRLGQLQTAMGLISILQDYEVTLNPEWPCSQDPKSVFTIPLDGFKLNLRKM